MCNGTGECLMQAMSGDSAMSRQAGVQADAKTCYPERYKMRLGDAASMC